MALGEDTIPASGQINPQDMGMQMPGGEENMSEEEMRSDLERSFEDLKSKEGAFQSRRIESQNKLRQLKIQIIQRLFMTMRDLGVDPERPESVKNFLLMLEQEDPDLFAIFSSAMNGVFPDQEVIQEEGSSEGGGGEATGEGAGLMDRYSDLSKTILRQ